MEEWAAHFQIEPTQLFLEQPKKKKLQGNQQQPSKIRNTMHQEQYIRLIINKRR